MLKQSKYWTLPISPTESMYTHIELLNWFCLLYLVASLNYCNVNLFQILSCILNINVIHNTLNKLCVAIHLDSRAPCVSIWYQSHLTLMSSFFIFQPSLLSSFYFIFPMLITFYSLNLSTKISTMENPTHSKP